jgi:hypothetical protein
MYQIFGIIIKNASSTQKFKNKWKKDRRDPLKSLKLNVVKLYTYTNGTIGSIYSLVQWFLSASPW